MPEKKIAINETNKKQKKPFIKANILVLYQAVNAVGVHESEIKGNLSYQGKFHGEGLEY